MTTMVELQTFKMLKSVVSFQWIITLSSRKRETPSWIELDWRLWPLKIAECMEDVHVILIPEFLEVNVRSCTKKKDRMRSNYPIKVRQHARITLVKFIPRGSYLRSIDPRSSI